MSCTAHSAQGALESAGSSTAGTSRALRRGARRYYYDVSMRGSSLSSDAVVVPLSGGAARASAAVTRLLNIPEPQVLTLSEFSNGGRKRLQDGGCDHLALVGAPPEDEIGYSLGALLALIGRPERVSLVDLDRDDVVSWRLPRYAVRAAPLAAAQLSGSALALAAQTVVTPFVSRGRTPNVTGELTRVVYVRPAVGSVSGVGGAVTHTHEVIRALQAESVAVEAFTTDARIAETARREPDPPCEWKVASVPRATKAVPASAAVGGDLALVRASLSAARKADAIYQRHARFSLAGPLLARLTGKPLLLEFNGSEVFKGRYWNPTPFRMRLARCEEAALRAASLIVVVSEVDRRLLIERGIPRGRVILSPNGVDASRFGLGGGQDVRERLGLDDGDEIVIGFVGTFGPWHGAPTLARAFVELAEGTPSLRLLLVGDGPELGPTLEILRAGDVMDRVRGVGRVTPDVVAAHLDACDILVSPHVPLPDAAEFFGSPTKLFEYMAAGKPIVASRLGQIGEVLEDRVTALLTEPGDAAELVAAVSTLAADPTLRRKLGDAARETAVEHHSWRHNARRLIDAYRELVEGTWA
jgi:glycosyltransferase involved in cell wall biosynthesis